MAALAALAALRLLEFRLIVGKVLWLRGKHFKANASALLLLSAHRPTVVAACGLIRKPRMCHQD